MFFMPLDLLTVLMVVLFVANAIQSLARYLEFPQPHEGILVVVSASLGYAIYNTFGRQFNDGYIQFEKMTVAVFGPQYWTFFFIVAVGVAAAVLTLRRAQL